MDMVEFQLELSLTQLSRSLFLFAPELLSFSNILTIEVSSISQSISTISIASNNTNIVSMSSSYGIVYREAMGNLTYSVGSSLSLSFSLAIEAMAIALPMAIAQPMAIGHPPM